MEPPTSMPGHVRRQRRVLLAFYVLAVLVIVAVPCTPVVLLILL